LAAARSRIVERRATHRLMEQALREHGDDVLESSEQALRAAQARFAVDPAAVTEWGMAIDQRVRALVTQAGSMQRWLVATFDLSEALGPPPDDPARAADGGKTADAANPEARR
ncbi:MAG TPA: hypothetical protein VFC77_03335, partial [Myxococcota bacterium]|nr:hypothetical protein [Myxococcota bacterium]